MSKLTKWFKEYHRKAKLKSRIVDGMHMPPNYK